MTLTSVFGNIALSLIVASVFYNLDETTNSFFQRGALLFFAILLNAFASALEIMTLWQQRPIVEKHDKYALYHPSAEAISSMIVELPSKIVVAVVFNIILYFLTNLRRTVGHFFVFFLFTVSTTLTMSNIFRWIGAISRSMAQAQVPSSIFMLILIIYTGQLVPRDYQCVLTFYRIYHSSSGHASMVQMVELSQSHCGRRQTGLVLIAR